MVGPDISVEWDINKMLLHYSFQTPNQRISINIITMFPSTVFFFFSFKTCLARVIDNTKIFVLWRQTSTWKTPLIFVHV